MKHVIKTSTIVLASMLFIMTSCSKSNTPATQQTAVDPSVAVTSGNWTITSLTQRNEDKTSSFRGYTFTFVTGGVLKAELNSVITNGSWSYVPSAVIYYGSTGSNASFVLNLGTSSPLNRLTKTWNIDSTNTTTSKITLKSPEVAEGEQLIFTKVQ